MAKPPKVSIIIPAYNEATYIDRLLQALSEQNYKDFEVIVSDAQSKDGTKEVVESFKTKLDIKFFEAAPKGPAFGRNQGAKHARADWLLFLDADDDIDDTNFIKTLLREAGSHNWQTASTKMKVKGSLIERFGTWLNYQYTKLLQHSKHPVAAGWCILTKRELFESLNGFNEKIQFGEDYDYVTRAGNKGFGFTDKTYYYMDLRRARGEGIRFVLKGIANEIYRHSHGYNLERNPVNYEFGKHQKRGN
ncbi:MAG TPA: glycosyltransferase family A protein [Candidatus Saccharimonadales bacterium]|nr:glycosyltransferase family A protein [Candidatus Saccharimonadales bacterium]